MSGTEWNPAVRPPTAGAPPAGRPAVDWNPAMRPPDGAGAPRRRGLPRRSGG